MLRRCWLIGLLCLPLPALADTDYRCLSECKNQGGQTAACMQQCTYYKPVVATSTAHEGDAHREFSTPVPVGARSAPKAEVAMQKDMVGRGAQNFTCVQDCLKRHIQSTLCQAQCAARDK
ncbi:MAG: hypothetical protein K2Q01_10805 [Rickettsiales bacterium]|nr:hypothetical protein [Rickettsiales bacterium]